MHGKSEKRSKLHDAVAWHGTGHKVGRAGVIRERFGMRGAFAEKRARKFRSQVYIWGCIHMSLTANPGGRDCFSLSALSKSLTQRVYRYFEHLTLNLTTSLDFLILTAVASFLRAVSKKSLISLICFGCELYWGGSVSCVRVICEIGRGKLRWRGGEGKKRTMGEAESGTSTSTDLRESGFFTDA